MTKTPIPFLLVLFAACASEGPIGNTAAPKAVPMPASAPSPLDDSDCNLATPLQPGIPGSPGHLITSARNPNGDSELAALMRTFVDDVQHARALVEAGQPVPKMLPTHRKMRCAWPTRPEERNARFDGLAQTYLQAVHAFDTAPTKATYNGIVNGCIACHSQSCGGPLEYLDGMRWH